MIFASAPPSDPTYKSPPTCTSSAALPILDGVAAGYQTFRVILAVNGPDQVQGAPFDRKADIALGLGFGALAIGSTIYGANITSKCKAYEAGYRNAESRDSDAESPSTGSGQASQDEGQAENAAKPASPTGWAGFQFGESVEEVKASCLERQGSFTTEPSGPTCSWVREQNMVRAQLDFCDAGGVTSQLQALCHINMQTTPPSHDGRTWRKVFSSLRAQLQPRFGTPRLRRLHFPDACQAPENFYQCLLDGRIQWLQTWTWGDGHEVKLTLGIAQLAQAPSVIVSLATPDYSPPASPTPVTTVSPSSPPPPTASAAPPPPPAPSAPIREFPNSKAPN